MADPEFLTSRTETPRGEFLSDNQYCEDRIKELERTFELSLMEFRQGRERNNPVGNRFSLR